MIADIVGNETAEKVLLYLEQYGEGYASAIAETFETPVSMVLRQLNRFERAGAIVSTQKGRTRLFTWNPRSIFVEDVRSLARKALDALPDEERRRYFSARRRPRRAGKPL